MAREIRRYQRWAETKARAARREKRLAAGKAA